MKKNKKILIAVGLLVILIVTISFSFPIFFRGFCLLPIPDNVPNESREYIRSSCGYTVKTNKNINILPMYGEIEKTEEQKKADKEFIEETIKLAGNRENAFKKVIDIAWKFSNENKLDESMKRFNQAWLLDSENPEVFMGFGVVVARSGDLDRSIEFFNEGLNMSPNNKLKGEIFFNLGTTFFYKSKNVHNLKEKNIFLEGSNKYYEEAVLKNQNKSYYYSSWAWTLYELGEYEKCLEIVNEAKKLGSNVPESFEKDLLEKLE